MKIDIVSITKHSIPLNTIIQSEKIKKIFSFQELGDFLKLIKNCF